MVSTWRAFTKGCGKKKKYGKSGNSLKSGKNEERTGSDNIKGRTKGKGLTLKRKFPYEQTIYIISLFTKKFFSLLYCVVLYCSIVH